MYQIRELTNLRRIAEKFDVRFELVGSVPRRVLLSQFTDHFEANSLFSLSPYLSNVDLVHSGTRNLTPKIVREILYRLPFAEAFRWQVTAISEQDAYNEFLRLSSHEVPDNLLRLNEEGLTDPAGATRDYESRIFRFGYNENYDASRLRNGDLPLFAVLMYLRNLLQARPWLKGLELWEQPAMNAIRRAVADSASEQRIADLKSSQYLRNRFFFLFSAFASASPDSSYFEDVLGSTGLSALLDILIHRSDSLGSALQHVREEFRSRRARLVSSSVRKLPRTAKAASVSWEIEQDAITRLGRYLGGPAAQEESDVPLLVSSPIQLEAGFAAGSRIVGDEVHELLHLDVPITPVLSRIFSEYPEERLGVALGLCDLGSSDLEDDIDVPGALAALPATCSYRDGSRREGSALQIRINCYGFLEKANGILRRLLRVGPAAVRVFVLRPRAVGEPFDSESQFRRPGAVEFLEREDSEDTQLVLAGVI